MADHTNPSPSTGVARLTDEQIDEAPQPSDGWETVRVLDLPQLIEALERAYRKGYMPDAMIEAWEAFDFHWPADSGLAVVGVQVPADLSQRLRESADEVESFPHPSYCDHLHVAPKVMREAADAIDRLAALASSPSPQIQSNIQDHLARQEKSDASGAKTAVPYPASKALEFAEYMAKAADEFIQAALQMVNEYHEADDVGRNPDIEALAQPFDECLRGLRLRIYEFRKRAAKVASVVSGTSAATTVAACPPMPSHPEHHSMTWTRLERECITEYGLQCFRAGRVAA